MNAHEVSGETTAGREGDPFDATRPANPAAFITNEQADVLQHTERTGRYVTGDAAVIAMGGAGLLHDHGAQTLADGQHYFTLTGKGRSALHVWRDAQPKPEQKPRARSSAFDAWQTYCEICERISFADFWKDVWPTWRDRA